MNYINIARENIQNYTTFGDEAMIDIQHLVAVIIGTKKATPELTGKIAQDGVRGLINITVQELEDLNLTHNQALKVHAAIILAKKIAHYRTPERFMIKSPDDIASYLKPKIKDLNQENFVALYLNTKNKIIHEKTIFIGSLNASVVHPREIFNTAIKMNAESVIVAHNHPSGDPEPSPEDINATKRLADAGDIVGIELLDHIIIGNPNYKSLKELGHMI